MWATRAQALAMLGRQDEAASSLKNADQVSDLKFMPALAGVLWRRGLALRCMDREDAAIQQFEQAKKADPNGLYGNLATSAMQEHKVLR
jgi:tetratricopeptide (TPR) repeat protein